MFFVLAKVFWGIVQPLSLAALLTLATFVLLLTGFRALATVTAGLALTVLGLSGWTTLGALLLAPLEERFKRPPAPATVAGIVMLGGSFEGGVNRARGGYEMNSSADRVIETAVLAERYPEARIVVSGGSGALVLEGEGDADTASRLFPKLGFARNRLVLERRSRDTFENALFTKQLVQPKPGETWLLVTSAFHMPRSMALFRKAGFEVVPWPTDYRTQGNEGFGLARKGPLDAVQMTTVALREWVGLLAYRLSGRIDQLLPAADAGEDGSPIR